MTPGRPFITALAPLPFAPGITARSIIAISGDGPMQNGDDGVVQYSRAHLGAAVSELVERSGHSSQSNLRTIAEVRRILRLHLQEFVRRRRGVRLPGCRAVERAMWYQS